MGCPGICAPADRAQQACGRGLGRARRGVRPELAEIPDAAAQAGIPVVFSAHGVSPVVKAEAERRGMHVVDATCPLVGKVHREVLRFVREGYEIVYIGHKGHDEAVGVVGRAPNTCT